MLKTASKHISIFIFSIVVFLILPFIKLSATIDPELSPRFLLISLLVLAFSMYYFFSGKKELVLSKDARSVFFLLICILGWMLIMLFRSLNPGDAMLEWLRIAILTAFFVISFIIFSNKQKPELFISRFSVGAAFIFCGYGFIQYYQMLNDLDENKQVFIHEVLTSSLANKNFFSEVLVLLLPFLFYGLIRDNRGWKILFILAVGSCLFFIVYIQSISSWLALFLGSVLFIYLSGRQNVRLFPALFTGKRRLMYIAVCVVLVVFAGYFYSTTKSYSQLNSKLKAVRDYALHPELLDETRIENNNSLFERFLLWRNTIKMTADHPMLGVGLNNWKIENPTYGISGTQHINTGLIYYEHPHNDYLLILAEQGPVGLGLYLGIFILFFLMIRRNLKNTESKLLLVLLACGVLSFMVLSLFAYPRSRIYPMLILMIYFATVLSKDNISVKGKIPMRLVASFMVVVSVFSSLASYSRLRGEIHTKQMLIAQKNKNYARMIREADLATSWFYPMDLTTTPLNWYRGMAWFYSGEYSEAIHQYEAAIKINPNHLRILNDLGTAYERAGERQRAIQMYMRALAITPLSIEVNLNLSAAYFNLRKIDSSFLYIDRIYNLPMSWPEEENYKKFLEAILYAKAFSEVSNYKDSTILSNSITKFTKKGFLKQLYMQSKEQKQPFTKILNNNLYQSDSFN